MVKKSNSPLARIFQADWYLDSYPDVREARINPLEHYTKFGWREKRRPHPLFDPEWYSSQYSTPEDTDLFSDYLTNGWRDGKNPHPLFDTERYKISNPDVVAADMNPLVHYWLYGRNEKRQPHDLFDTALYLRRNADVARSGMDPFSHYLQYGWREGRDPTALFDVKYYLNSNPDVAEAGIEPLAHYFLSGWREGRRPHPLFDIDYYLQRNSDVAAHDCEPLSHFLAFGAAERRSPHPLFDVNWYLAKNPDVLEAGINPLSHYVLSGGRELRSPHPLFDPQFYKDQLDDRLTETPIPLMHYLSDGAKLGLNPNRLFNGSWYLDQHETLRFSDFNPLLHYVTRGRHELRDPHPNFDIEWYLAVNTDVDDSGTDPLAHYLSSGITEGRQPAPPNRESTECAVLDIPFELRYSEVSFKGKNACVFVTFSSDGEISKTAKRHLASYQAAGYLVALVVVTDGISKPIGNRITNANALIIRQNHGWDFAAWACALSALPDLWQASQLILANDSVFGPVAKPSLDRVIDDITRSPADIVALTDSYQNYHHYMSYFVAYKRSALQSKAVQRFWDDVKSLKNKDLVIATYELPALKFFKENGLSVDILFPTKFGALTNPTLADWKQLLIRGLPYVKVQALRDRLDGVDSSGWQDMLAENPGLIEEIEDHLNVAKKTDLSSFGAPVPAPKRRFKRPVSLKNDVGATPAVRPTEHTDLVIKIPFYQIAEKRRNATVAVIAHIFYPDLAREIRGYLENIPNPADIFISTDDIHKKSKIEAEFSDYANGEVVVAVFPNKGRDIAPVFVGFRDVLDRYEYILHIHSKRSLHSDVFRGWREYLLETLLGSQEKILSIFSILDNSDAGVVFADHFRPVRNLLNWGHNFDACARLLGRIGISIDQGLVLEFPSSSFFWAKSKALRPLADLELDWSDFQEEEGQIDGTLAHAIERSLLYVVESAGYSWAKVGCAPYVSDRRLIEVFTNEQLAATLDRTYRPLLGNLVRPYQYYNLIPEERSVSARAQYSARPRINLVIPTLKPEYIFGGINTAIKIFDEIANNFGIEVDKRILVQSTPVDMSSTREFSSYRMVQPGSPYDDYKETIVDVCDRKSEAELTIRSNDIFVSTAWWTQSFAEELRSFQRFKFGDVPKAVYLVQDFEAGFYPWSNQYCLADETYKNLDSTVALINSEELASFMDAKHQFEDARVIRYKPNRKVLGSISPQPRERVIIFYGRPGTPRNSFQSICKGIALWQSKNPALASSWKILSLGEDYRPRLAAPVTNLSILGKLSLEEYGAILSRASIGISLMVSPHPSYPPLEMAAAGLHVLTNSYDYKDLSRRSPNIHVLDNLAAETIAERLSALVGEAEKNIGGLGQQTSITDLESRFPEYSPLEVAKLILESLVLDERFPYRE